MQLIIILQRQPFDNALEIEIEIEIVMAKALIEIAFQVIQTTINKNISEPIITLLVLINEFARNN